VAGRLGAAGSVTRSRRVHPACVWLASCLSDQHHHLPSRRQWRLPKAGRSSLYHCTHRWSTPEARANFPAENIN
jgi:hypothetical protein